MISWPHIPSMNYDKRYRIYVSFLYKNKKYITDNNGLGKISCQDVVFNYESLFTILKDLRVSNKVFVIKK